MYLLLLLGLLLSLEAQRRPLPLANTRHHHPYTKAPTTDGPPTITLVPIVPVTSAPTLLSTATATPTPAPNNNDATVLGLSFGTLGIILVTCCILAAVARFTGRRGRQVSSPV